MLPRPVPWRRSDPRIAWRFRITFPAPLLVLAAIVSIQVGSALATQLFPALGALGTVAWRLAFAALMLLFVSRPRPDFTERSAVVAVSVFGVAIASMNALFYLAIERVPLGVVVAVEFLGPLGLAAWTAKRWRDRLWVVLALLGVVLVTPFGDSGYDLLGLIFAGLAGIGWACFVLLSTRVGALHPGNSGIALGMAVAALLLAPMAVVSAPALFAHPAVLLTMLAVALFSTAVPFSLEFRALRRLSPTVYGTLIALEPAAATVAGAWLLDQAPSARALLAVGLVTLAAIGSTLGKE
ncbi:MAG: EamA family transporter [Pseudomonadales bacterium]|jgi:inner membrane transporter RhtA|nr:EamA family transporter [Pseudomonadales bacterium]